MNKEILIATVFEEGKYPVTKHNEIAICGRSNCGKSTLINALLRRKSMARASSKPGKTVSINFYNYDEKLVLADLPGYGYAKVPDQIKKKWKSLVDDYLYNRPQLKTALILSDVRRGLQVEEISFISWLKENNINTLVVMTKTDKLSNSELSKAKRDTLAQVSNLWQDMEKKTFFVSSNNKEGLEDLKKELRTYYK
ncbi:MAG: ribosome biogenesis GTP-binding protein YihA/YsxC [bacterium]